MSCPATGTSKAYSITYTACRPLGYGRVYLPLYKVADTPFHIQGVDVYTKPTNNQSKHSNKALKMTLLP